MTRRSKRELERAVDDLAGDGGTDDIFVVAIGGDPNRPAGWLTPEEYEQHYGDRPESDFTFTVNPGGRQ